MACFNQKMFSNAVNIISYDGTARNFVLFTAVYCWRGSLWRPRMSVDSKISNDIIEHTHAYCLHVLIFVHLVNWAEDCLPVSRNLTSILQKWLPTFFSHICFMVNEGGIQKRRHNQWMGTKSWMYLNNLELQEIGILNLL